MPADTTPGKTRTGQPVADIVGGILDLRDAITDPSQSPTVGNAGRAVCDALSSVGYDSIPLNNRTGPGFICEPYWQDEGFDPPQDVAPFQGGQCAGTRYRVTIANGVVRREFGPIVGISKEPSPAGNGFIAFLVYEGGAGKTQVDSGPTLADLDDANIVDVVAEIGPDDCGDPPSESQPGPVNPGAPYGTPRPVTGSPGVTITVGSPIVYEGDDFYWPVEINFNGEPVGPPIRFTPDGLPPDIEPEPTIEDGQPSEPLGDGGDVDEPEDEDPNSETIGYRFELLGERQGFGRIPNTNPVIYPRTVGNLQLKLESSNGDDLFGDLLLIRSQKGSILRSSEEVKVTGIRYYKTPDFSGIRLTPIKVRTETEES